MSRTWFVSPAGADQAAGTIAQPLRTIQDAANLAQPGDSVEIRAGIYRETVRPAQSGVTFEAYDNESVTLSGADVLTGWSGASGNVWKAPMSWDLGEGNNQVFVDGKAVNEARWPNTTDLTHPTVETAPSISGGTGRATITDPRLSAGWAGATIHILPGEGWYAQTGTVVQSGPGWLTFTYQPDTSYTVPRSGNTYYLYGKLQGLDSPGEWFRDNSGQLFLWTPTGDSANAHVVEVKRRAYAFDLINDSNITIRGIRIVAATIETNSLSSNLTLDHIHASYLSQFTWQSIGWQQPWDSGIELNGNNSVLENSTISWSSGDGVYVGGVNCRVTGNVIHDVDTNAGDSAPVRDYGADALIDHNVIYNAGRCGVILKGSASSVIGNTIFDAMLQTSDGGGVYTIHQNGSGSQIAYNTIYGIHDRLPSPHPDWYPANGIFLDDYSSNFSIHDNTILDADAAIKLNYSSRGNHVFNNALQGSLGSVLGNGRGDWGGTVISGNTLYSPITTPGGGASMTGNAYARGVPRVTPANVPADLPPVVPPAGSPASVGSVAGSGSGSEPTSTSAGGPGASGDSSGSVASVPAGKSVDQPLAATSFDAMNGIQVPTAGVLSATPGNFVEYQNLDFSAGVRAVTLQLAAFGKTRGFRIELRLDSPTGPLIGQLRPHRGNRRSPLHLQTARLRKTTGVHNLFLVFVGRQGQVQVTTISFVAAAKRKKSP